MASFYLIDDPFDIEAEEVTKLREAEQIGLFEARRQILHANRLDAFEVLKEHVDQAETAEILQKALSDLLQILIGKPS